MIKVIRGVVTNGIITAGTPVYAPPENHFTDHVLTPAFDVWSLGMMLYEMLTQEVLIVNMLTEIGKAHYNESSRVDAFVNAYFADPEGYPRDTARRNMRKFMTKEVLRRAQNGSMREAVKHELIDQQAEDLIVRMLTPAEERPSIKELMSHRFFEEDYTEYQRSDPAMNRFRTVRVLRHMNAGEVATNTARALRRTPALATTTDETQLTFSADDTTDAEEIQYT